MSFQSPVLREYPSYKSPYGPKYHYQPHVGGYTFKQIARLGLRASAFGGVALFGVIYYASGIPRVKKDILQKIPFLGGYFIDHVPASDNPF
ncbi:ubiquinol-cytochrome-c reductase complex subunit-domain-containing protein [Daldinia caldariorum]|uniref:ubiquinol-cytochrome-c reductase complex subunit-domain-containing protein n=1 Tax=Daldinia caldariorum TaxID=326644 RepID=UPI0020074772|nr:ubiquinol-cytochrome-c reductase complex subunit-domain-containing protein [Daldinia caldariorum]KAI1470562.1 ubiquinol-cytochrome-c reductase complex subunit-domain-containing protein [Daldinia caldariorum]